MTTIPQKRSQFEQVQELMDEYRRIKENSAQALALVQNLENSLSIIFAEADLEQVFTSDELDFINETHNKIMAWKSASANK